jgi:hypothetical protein
VNTVCRRSTNNSMMKANDVFVPRSQTLLEDELWCQVGKKAMLVAGKDFRIHEVWRVIIFLQSVCLLFFFFFD